MVATTRSIEQISELGRRSDRWRFAADDEEKVKSVEMCNDADKIDINSLDKCPEYLGTVGECEGSEVPLSFIGEDWAKVDGARWDRMEPIPVLEGRSVVWLMQHLARSQKNLARKPLILSDSMSVVLAVSKGRSSSRALNRVCRQLAALGFLTMSTCNLDPDGSHVN